jgi:hypothetical protein
LRPPSHTHSADNLHAAAAIDAVTARRISAAWIHYSPRRGVLCHDGATDRQSRSYSVRTAIITRAFIDIVFVIFLLLSELMNFACLLNL